MFNNFWMLGIVFCASHAFMKNLDQPHNIVLHIFMFWSFPVEQIKKLEVETQTESLDNNIIHVQVTVVFPHQMYFFQPFGKGVKQMQGFIGCQTVTRKIL